MAVIGRCRFVTLAIVCTLPTLLSQDDYEIPEPSIVALKPSGLWVSIPANDPKIEHVTINGNIQTQCGKILGPPIFYGMVKSKGFWIHRNNLVQLKVGDVFYFNLWISREKKLLKPKIVTYPITELVELRTWKEPTAETPVSKTTIEPAPNPSEECKPTSTSVLWPGFMKTICSGQIIFEDNFDTLRDDLWTIEEYIPSKPEYPFVSYQQTTVSVENGMLRIEPQLQEDLPGFDLTAITCSTLDLSSRCTRPGSCVASSNGCHILPPIASGRITSKLFSFKYGTVDVRAKVPQGDWLYPDILLESLSKKYGMDDYASGFLKIAGVLGNVILRKGNEEYGNKVLSGGPVMDFKCHTNLLFKKFSATEWGKDFHVYSLQWAPDSITLFVDGEEWGRIEAPIDGLQSRLPRDTCKLLHRTFLKTPMAPFDDYFNIILGVTAGGVREFPDDVVSLYTTLKPWKNTGRRARLDFLTAKDNWLPTWTQPALLVDYIKVWAL